MAGLFVSSTEHKWSGVTSMTTTNTNTKDDMLAALAAFAEEDLALALRAAESSRRSRERTLESYFLHEFLGEQRKIENGKPVLSIDVQDWMLNPGAILHGGVTALLCDNTLGMVSYLHQQRPGVTVDLNVRYHLPVRSGLITGTGEVVSAGSSISSARGEVRDAEGRLVATATGTFYHRKR